MSSVWNTAENLLLGSGTSSPVQDDHSVKAQNSPSVINKASSEAQKVFITGVNDAQEEMIKTEEVHSSIGQISHSNTSSGQLQWKSGSINRIRGGSNLPAAVAEGIARHNAHQQLIYKKKYTRLKRMVKDTVLSNAALCDLVADVQHRILFATEENKCLLRKLHQFQGPSDSTLQSSNNKGTGNIVSISAGMVCDSLDVNKVSTSAGKIISKKRSEISHGSSSSDRSKLKKSRSSKPKRLCPPITLDSAGRPIFPITLGPLTIHSLGDIISERDTYHTENVIYPVGFCSTRTYASISDPQNSVLYTCKVLDGSHSPKFEIVCEEEVECRFTGGSPAECHLKILMSINKALGMELLTIRSDSSEATERGLRFFGLSHPSIQNVIQACPGARKCTKYKWVRFEVCRSEAEVDSVFEVEREASICHESLMRNIRFARHHVSSN